ncbi:MAG: hypothetical protein ABIQ93_04415 [Saprospiraceae bacterium]
MTATIKEEENRTKGVIISLIFHAGLVLMMLMYTFTKKPEAIDVPPITINWGGGGDNAAAGLPDEGQGSKAAPQGQQMEDPSVTEPVNEPVPAPSKATPPPPSASKPASAPPAQTTPTSADPDVAALKKAQEETRRKQDDANRQRQAQDEVKRQAEAQRQAQAQAAAAEQKRQQDEKDKKKGQFGGTFGKPGATGSGQGNTGKPGNQGIPTGTGDNPFGKSNGDGGGTGGGSGTGTGVSVGGGLGGRPIQKRGPINDTSQKAGKIVVEICVDANGVVTSANYTQRGSTTTDTELRGKALASAKQYRFAPGGSGGTDCGTLTFNFRLQ